MGEIGGCVGVGGGKCCQGAEASFGGDIAAGGQLEECSRDLGRWLFRTEAAECVSGTFRNLPIFVGKELQERFVPQGGELGQRSLTHGFDGGAPNRDVERSVGGEVGKHALNLSGFAKHRELCPEFFEIAASSNGRHRLPSR